MGSRLGVLVEASSLPDATRVTEDVILEVERLARILSTWGLEGEMQRVNTAPVGQASAPGPELAALLAEAERYSRATGEAFDARVGALVDAWDLRGAGVVPTEVALTRALHATSTSGISVDRLTGVTTRHAKDAWIDTGGFGKGAALRSVARLLEVREIDRALIDLGGQLWAKADALHPWSVHIAHPVWRQRPVARLEVYGVSVATSGTSERFVEIDGIRWGHILDPRTGRPVPAWGSVTVVTADPMAADAFATALYVMGPFAGLAWAERQPGLDALFLVTQPGALAASWTRGMQRWLIDPPRTTAAEPKPPTTQTGNHQ
ncbi:MAG: FAD:protein FMN transferase [Gemmatimonadota bacterium]|nr:FAD:protein FMN transferase [Gemmatimonadota bacterium]